MAKAQGVTDREQSIVQSLIRQRESTPDRVLAELDRVKPALKQLIDKGISIKDILNRFIKQLEVRVTSSQARTYIKEHFDYPPDRLPRDHDLILKARTPKKAVAKKVPSKPAKKAVKKAAKKKTR